MRSRSPVLILAVALCAVVGCGGGGVEVTGKVTKGGAAFVPAEGEGVSITLTSDDGSTVCSGTSEKDGSFTIKATGDKSVPPGKYKVTVTHYLPKQNGAGASVPTPKTYPEDWTVSADSKSFNLDMTKLK